MNCDEVEGCISAFADNEISGEREDRIRTHLQECKECNRLYRFELSTKKLVNSVAVQKAPAGLRERIVASVKNADFSNVDRENAVDSPSWIWGFFGRKGLVFSTAAVVLLFIGVFVTISVIFGGEKMSPFINSVYAHHVNPSEDDFFDGTCEEIEGALASRLEREFVAVPSFEDFRLEVSCAFCEMEIKGKNCFGAVLRYKGDKGDFSHFVICSRKVPIDKLPALEDNPEFHFVNKDGINMVFWYCSKTKTTRCIASDCSMEELVDIMEEFVNRSVDRFQEKGLI